MDNIETSIIYNGWQHLTSEYDDGDGFVTIDHDAKGPNGKIIRLDTSRFKFQMTEERFQWFVDNGFPRREYFNTIGPIWSSDIDKEIVTKNASPPQQI